MVFDTDCAVKFADIVAYVDSRREPIIPRWLTVTTVILVALFLGASLITAPYVIERPGPVANTLGEITIGEKTVPMITIEDAETYPADGTLNLLTVSIVGNPEESPSLAELFAAMIDPTQEIVPMEQIYPPGLSTEDRKKANEREMTSSQDAAVAASLTTLGIPFEQTLSVAEVGDTSPAKGKLRKGDVFVAVNGEPVTSYASLRASITENGTSKPALISVLRAGVAQNFEVTPVSVTNGDETQIVIGVQVKTEFEFPFEVDIQVDRIGGPSAGLVFALGITDLLSGDNFSEGLVVSGTGTVDADGNVGAIGGLPQKVVSAQRAKSDVLLIPHDQCSEIPAGAFETLRVVPVETLDEAVDALNVIQSKSGGQVPSCIQGDSAESSH